MTAEDRSRGAHACIFVPEPDLEVWEEKSDYDEAGRYAGVPVPSAATQLGLAATGDQTAKAIQVQTQQGGVPSLDASVDSGPGTYNHLGARAIVRVENDAGTGYDPWLGYDPANFVESWEPIVASSTTPEYVRDPDVETMDGGVILTVAQVRDTTATSEFALVAKVRDPSTGTQAHIDIEAQATAPTQDFVPVVVKLDSGRIHVYRCIGRLLGGTRHRSLRLWYSDDGVTWAHGGDGLLDTEFTDAAVRMRIATNDRQMLLLIGTDADSVRQYASSDGGQSFQFIEELEASGSAPVRFEVALADVTTGPNGEFIVGFVGYYDATKAYTVTLSDATSKVSEASAVELRSTGMAFGDSELALVTSPAGEIYALLRGSANDDHSYVSYDAGTTWQRMEGTRVIGAGTATEYTTQWAAAWQRGRAVLAHSWESATASWAGKLALAYLGGFSDVAVPSMTLHLADQTAAGVELHYLPMALPSAMNWTTAGAGTQALSVGTLIVSCSAGQTRVYTGGTGDTRAFRFHVSVGAAVASTAECSVYLRTVAGYAFSIRISPSQIDLYDENSAAVVASSAGSFSANVVCVWAEYDATSGEVSVWWRYRDHGEARKWTLLGTVTMAAGAAATDLLEWGCRAAPAATAVSTWHLVQTVDVADRPFSLGGGQLNPQDLRGRALAGHPYMAEGVSTKARGGPTWKGERWTISPRAQFGLDKALAVASPSVGHRTTDTAAKVYTLRWDKGAGDSFGARSVLGLLIQRNNWPELAYRLGDGTTWTPSATVSLVRAGMAYTRTGRTVRPASGGTYHPYFFQGERDGATFVLSATKARRILSHPEGSWRNAAALQPTLTLADVDGSEPASGTGGIVPDQVLVLIPLGSTARTAIEITVPAGSSGQEPAETYYEAGNIRAGWIYPLGTQYEWGREISTEPLIETITTRDGQTHSRVAGATARRASIQWIARDMTEAEEEEAQPGYVLTTLTGEAGASEVGTAMFLEGLMRQQSGAHRQIGYLPKVVQSDSVQVLHRRRDCIFGRIASGSVVYEAVNGQEHTDEVACVKTLIIQEER